MKIIIRNKQLVELQKHAKVLSKKEGREICGMLINNGTCVDLLQVRNKAKKMGSFCYYYREIRNIKKAANLLGYEIIGSFHSHPFSVAYPSNGDIAGAIDKSYMLIISVPDKDVRLWYLSNGRKYKRKFELI